MDPEQQPATGDQQAPEPQQPATGDQQAPEPQQPADAAAELAKWKRLARQNETRAKTTQQQLQEAVSRAEAAETAALRASVAAAAGLPPLLADRLLGATREELETDAAQVAALLRPTVPPVDAVAPGTGSGQGTRSPADELAAFIGT